MPNGGSDNCGTCWFNRANEGRTAQEVPRPRQEAGEQAWCTIRGIEVSGPYWAYCANHQYHNPDRVEFPVGPVYTCFIRYSPRVIQIPSDDTPEIRAGLLRLLENMPETPAEGSPTETGFDEEVVKQLMKLREKRAVAGLRRVAGFDPLASTPDEARFPRNRVATVAWATQALGVMIEDAALPELEAGVKAGLAAGRGSDLAKQLREIRLRAVIGLSRCTSREAGQLIRRAALDSDLEVARAAVEVWHLMAQEAG